MGELSQGPWLAGKPIKMDVSLIGRIFLKS
jgi:hypothetical protein